MPISPRFASLLWLSLFLLILAGLGLAIGWQSWLLFEQDRRIALLEETANRVRAQNLRMSHGITSGQRDFETTLWVLRREVAALKQDKARDDEKNASDQPKTPLEAAGGSPLDAPGGP